MQVTKHVPGVFCWVELGTSDQNAAKQFYGEMFGWNFNDVPIGPDGVYSMFKLNGGDVAAAYTLTPEEQAAGLRSYWGLYISVENADTAVQAISAAGGKIEAGPFDVFDVGRMAIAQDPTGAHFKIWQPLNHIGVSVLSENNAMCWQELATRDLDGAKKFYSTVFGWEPKTSDDSPMAYTENTVKAADGSIHMGGAMYKMMPHMEGIPPHWMPYFSVADCDGFVAKASSLGAKAHVPPMDIPNVGRFSMLTDPQGAAFAVIKLNDFS